MRYRRSLILPFIALLIHSICDTATTYAHKLRETNLSGQHPIEWNSDNLFESARSSRRPTPDAYNSMRDMFFKYEESKTLGADIELNQRELEANQIIMSVKTKEYEDGLITPHLFAPSQHLFSVLKQISASPLFTYISEMPKGAVLHAHDTALCSTDYLIELTYRPKLWMCQAPGGVEAIELLFSNQKPENTANNECSWILMTKARAVFGADKVDESLRKRLTLYPTEKFLDNNAAWQQFSTIFRLVNGLLLYAPNWADYYNNALREFYADGVQYLEFRTTLPRLYDLEGTNYTEIDTVRIYKQTRDKFMAANSGFIGSKLIYAPHRNAGNSRFSEYISIAKEIKAKYPDFFAGFDLVGQEELGRPLKDFVPQLLAMPDDIDFYFHAGETNWYGSTVDENLIDAVLLGTKRIGHGFSLIKHPFVLQILKQHNIAIEVNPISNQVLQLISDYRNHPCAHFFANNFPVVISSDDPSFWKATPLSHDFYIAFLGIASEHADIRLLKKLAMNSIKYSSLDAKQKLTALDKWQRKWDAYIELVITGRKNGALNRLQTNHIN